AGRGERGEGLLATHDVARRAAGEQDAATQRHDGQDRRRVGRDHERELDFGHGRGLRCTHHVGPGLQGRGRVLWTGASWTRLVDASSGRPIHPRRRAVSTARRYARSMTRPPARFLGGMPLCPGPPALGRCLAGVHGADGSVLAGVAAAFAVVCASLAPGAWFGFTGLLIGSRESDAWVYAADGGPVRLVRREDDVPADRRRGAMKL